MHSRLSLELRDRLQAGLQARAFARAGHEKVHGTAEEKRDRWDRMQTALDAELRRNPSLGFTGASKKVAEQLGVSDRTVRNHTKDPTKPKK